MIWLTANSAIAGQLGDSGQWRRALFLVSVLLLGMPLTGEVPPPPGLARAAGPSTTYTVLTSEALITGIVWGAIYSLAALLLVGCCRRAYGLLTRQPAPLLLVLFALVTTFWTVSKPKSVLDTLQSGGLLVLALGAAMSYLRYPAKLVSDLSWTFGASQAINLLAVALSPELTADSDGRWAGVTGSPNYLGQLSLCAVWASTAASVGVKAVSRTCHLILLVLAFIVLAGTGSVSSIVNGVLICCLTVMWVWVRASSRTRLVRWVTVWTVATWLLALLMSTGIQEWVTKFLTLVGRESHLTGRIGIWIAAASAFLERPWFGHGFGVDTESIGATSWATSFHNGFLELATKGGVVALVLLFFFMTQSWRDIKKSIVVHGHALIPWLPFTVVSLTYNLAETSFMVARSPVWVVLIAISLTSAAIAAANDRRRSHGAG